MEHRVRACPHRPNPVPAATQTPAPNSVQPPREVQQPFRGHGTARPYKESNDADVNVGTFFIHSISYYALIEIGSTHSYIASVVSINLGLTAKNSAREFFVISPLGQSVQVDRVYRGVPLELQGMSRLCNKRVTLRSNETDEVVTVGECRDYLSNVISTLIADKLVRKGCEAYLTYVSDYVFTKLSVEDICTVREFPGVFLEEFSRVPPNREVELGIDLLLGTTPVSIAPYCMAPKELTELKAQLQELIDRGFIRPSVSS
ncbi:uncharacterized protein LOC128036207 [Gossypium raimondii]|uniref:uncharacterized protein LOC128036207 n=1 Tax=Gossypium raimondii TaxID=29730 RepID=UPI00227A7A4A|nr:uncharacterized protein LOC128036207 [Gossypium raimondii]